MYYVVLLTTTRTILEISEALIKVEQLHSPSLVLFYFQLQQQHLDFTSILLVELVEQSALKAVMEQ